MKYRVQRAFFTFFLHSCFFTFSCERTQAYADYFDMMDLTERLVEGAAKEVLGTTKVAGAEDGSSLAEIDLKAPWRRVTMNDLVKEKTGACDACTLCMPWEILAMVLGSRHGYGRLEIGQVVAFAGIVVTFSCLCFG